MGHSAGAHIAALLALNADYLNGVNVDTRSLRGVIGLAGPYDFMPFIHPYMFDLFGPAEHYPQSQPINFVRADAPRMLLLHGLRDKTVSPHNTEHLAKALTAVGASVTANYYPQANHGDLVAGFSIPARRRVPVLAAVSEFIGA
jgi:acetyl esterase/lipase